MIAESTLCFFLHRGVCFLMSHAKVIVELSSRWKELSVAHRMLSMLVSTPPQSYTVQLSEVVRDYLHPGADVKQRYIRVFESFILGGNQDLIYQINRLVKLWKHLTKRDKQALSGFFPRCSHYSMADEFVLGQMVLDYIKLSYSDDEIMKTIFEETLEEFMKSRIEPTTTSVMCIEEETVVTQQKDDDVTSTAVCYPGSFERSPRHVELTPDYGYTPLKRMRTPGGAEIMDTDVKTTKVIQIIKDCLQYLECYSDVLLTDYEVLAHFPVFVIVEMTTMPTYEFCDLFKEVMGGGISIDSFSNNGIKDICVIVHK